MALCASYRVLEGAVVAYGNGWAELLDVGEVVTQSKLAQIVNYDNSMASLTTFGSEGSRSELACNVYGSRV